MSGVGITMSSDITQFYKTSDAMSRSTFVGKFSDSAMRVDSLAIDVFRERFGWEILKRFDDWEDKIRRVDRQIQATEKNRVQVENLRAQVSSLKSAKERRQQQGKDFNEKEQQQYDDAEQKLEKYYRTLSKNRKQLDVEVSELMNDRFRELDTLLAKVVECQLDFFKNVAAAQAEALATPLSNFKKEFCADVGAAATATMKPAQTEFSSDSEDGKGNDTDSEEEEALPTASPEKKPENGIFHAAPTVTPPAATPKAAAQSQSPMKRQGTHEDLLDMFTAGKSDSSAAAEKPKQPEAKPKVSAAVTGHDDLFGMFEADSSLATPSTKKLSVSPAGSRSASPAPRASAAAAAATAAKPASSFDHFDPFGSTAAPAAAAKATRSTSPSPSPMKATPRASQQSQLSADPFGGLDNHASHAAVEEYQQREKDRADDLAQRDSARSKVDGKLTAWEFKTGTTKNNLRTLLATLHTILPEGPNNRWKKVGLTDLLDVPQMKKSYRNAMLATHPDKWQSAPAEHKVVVQRCFEVLNDSWQAYQKEQGL